MLRKFVLSVAVLLALVAVGLMSQRLWPQGLELLVIAAVVFLGTAFESWRYRKGADPQGARWQHTDEKFADPISGEEMEVQYDPVSGQRRYVRR